MNRVKCLSYDSTLHRWWRYDTSRREPWRKKRRSESPAGNLNWEYRRCYVRTPNRKGGCCAERRNAQEAEGQSCRHAYTQSKRAEQGARTPCSLLPNRNFEIVSYYWCTTSSTLDSLHLWIAPVLGTSHSRRYRRRLQWSNMVQNKSLTGFFAIAHSSTDSTPPQHHCMHLLFLPRDYSPHAWVNIFKKSILEHTWGYISNNIRIIRLYHGSLRVATWSSG